MKPKKIQIMFLYISIMNRCNHYYKNNHSSVSQQGSLDYLEVPGASKEPVNFLYKIFFMHVHNVAGWKCQIESIEPQKMRAPKIMQPQTILKKLGF